MKTSFPISPKVIKISALIGCLWAIPVLSYAQDDDGIVKSIMLDSVVVTDVQKGFDVADFIQLIQQDTSFYHAFQNLRFSSYTSRNNIFLYDRKGKISASSLSITRQHFRENCRWTEVLKEEVTGNFFTRKNDYKYYTAELYAFLFLPKDTICYSRRTTAEEFYDDERNSRHATMLKTLIFNPGTDIGGVPLIGNKLNIFNPEMAMYYDYTIKSADYHDTIPCYIFEVKRKKGVSGDDVVIKHLSTWFSKDDFQVMSRKYNLSHETLLFDFDVQMNVELAKMGNEAIPQKIQYSGYWDIPLNKPERAVFEIRFWDYHLEK